jgi:hypothetical protein
MATVRLSMETRNGVLDDLATRYDNCVIGLYGGSMPAGPDSAEGTTLLALITVGSGAFTGGVATNGLGWESASGGSLVKATAETWSGLVLATGVVTWARIYANDYTTGASTTADRIDVDVATSGASINMGNTSVTLDGTATIDSATINLAVS